MGKRKTEKHRSYIVDTKGLARVLLCSESLILKTWKQYPHFYIGNGCNAKGARFDVKDVIEYLKSRDYANTRQNKENMDRKSKIVWVPRENKKGFQDKNSSKGMGEERKNKIDQSCEDPFNLLEGIN